MPTDEIYFWSRDHVLKLLSVKNNLLAISHYDGLPSRFRYKCEVTPQNIPWFVVKGLMTSTRLDCLLIKDRPPSVFGLFTAVSLTHDVLDT